MAECSFVRCVQERRAIKKELQRWTKNMVIVVGLERVAEELMGRRKWKRYQDLMTCHTSIPDETKDWEPQDKCCLCDEKTFLDRAPSPSSDPDSSSDDSIYCESPPVTSFPDNTPSEKPPTPAMTTFESVKLAAIAALNRSTETPPSLANNMFYPTGPGGLFAPWYLPPTLPPHLGGRPSPLSQNPLNPLAEGLRMEAIPSLKQETVNGPEQPLDLSAKGPSRSSPTIMPASPQSLRVPAMDNKHIFKAKPRMSAVAGRRTYTEDELQAALRDIQSGKLGTRRAAVIYGIPRSTLRNKVYKLAMERERDAQLLLNTPSQAIEVPDDDDKELSATEEEREVEKALRQPLLSMEDLVRFSMIESGGLANPEALRHLLQHGKMDGPVPFMQGDVWGGLEHSAVGSFISQALAANKSREALDPGDMLPKFLPPSVQDLMRRMMFDEKLFVQDTQLKRPPVNGALGGQEGECRPSPSSVSQREEETTSDAEATSSTVILKVPSFKPTSMGASPGVSEPFPSPSQESSSQPFNGDSRSPPTLVGKGIGVTLRDVIAKSISQKFQQGGDLTQIPLTQKLLLSPDVEPPFKRSRFSPPLPPIPAQTVIKHNNNNHNIDDRNAVKMNPALTKPVGSTTTSTTGGKGTRPKRGKYRNYDRDSLVEAVRAVQRGEMSVHRAGSYYGVPHSTLEYKVKERHLMRPRKRDPKPPLDDLKRKDDLRMPLQDKPKLGPPKLMKPAFPTSPLQNPPNGLKLSPLFDPAMSPLAYSTPPPFPFWPPNPFHPLPMPDFPRGPNAHEHFVASQMMQRLQEESSRVPNIPVPSPPVPLPAPLGKNTREMAESLYDGTGTNGTFLDGIIRSSLEMGLPSEAAKESSSEKTPENLSNKALLDQLCRNSRLTPLPVHDGSTSDDDSVKHAGVFKRTDSGKREDLSPSSDDSSRPPKLKENVEGDNFYVKSSRDRCSDNETKSMDSTEELSEKEDREDNDKSACDSKNILQKPVEVAAKDKVKEEAEEFYDTEEKMKDTKSDT